MSGVCAAVRCALEPGGSRSGGMNVADPLLLATRLVAALLAAPEEGRARALAVVRGAFPEEVEPPEERRRRLARDRKRRQRQQVTPDVTLERDRSVTESGTSAGPKRDQNGTAAGQVRDLGGRGEALSLSDSRVDLVPSEQIREGNVTEAAQISSPDEDVRIPMVESWELDEETRAAAAMLGLRGVDAAWAAFRAENLDAPPRTRRTWLAKFRDQWAPRAKRYETADGARGPSLRRPMLVQPAPPGGSVWKSGDGT